MDWIKNVIFLSPCKSPFTTQEGSLFWLERVVSEKLLVKEIRGRFSRRKLVIHWENRIWVDVLQSCGMVRAGKSVSGLLSRTEKLLIQAQSGASWSHSQHSVWGLSLGCHSESTRTAAGGTCPWCPWLISRNGCGKQSPEVTWPMANTQPLELAPHRL